ncbi:IS30 family transposase [Streptomyces sp. NPDC017529]|uniref:IS30 family transposase n=1 Tax=Streptomyces sp. NPDC017529 TaxID=3365000 RepID=UPI00379A1530
MDFKIRGDRTPQGPGKLSWEREAYSRLVQQGYSNTEACRIVGVDARTGRKWRNGRSADRRQKAAPPIHLVVPPSGPSRFLREDERMHIADRLREKATVRAIAAELGRSPSTVSREIRRNRPPEAGPTARTPPGPRRCPPAPPQAPQDPEESRAAGRRPGDAGRKVEPEQICHALRTRFPDRPEMHVVHETVYQALYVQGRGRLRRELAGALRFGRARRRPQRQANGRRPRFTTPMVVISERPAETEDRAVPGHWEGDLIIGKDGKSAIGTLVERATRYVMPLHLPGDHSAEAVPTSLTSTVQTLPAELKRSLTWDQGGEMARHGEFTSPPTSRSASATRQPLAARLEREHQRPAAAVLPQGHRPDGPYP